MCDQSTPLVDGQATDPALLRTLAAAGLPATGRSLPKAGWVSRAWVGDEYVVRLNNDDRFRDAYRDEATVVNLLAGSDVPHARTLAQGDGPDGPWYISERLPGRTLYDAWPQADSRTRQSIIESLGSALRALHRVPVPRRPAAALAGRRARREETVGCVPPARRECGTPAGRVRATAAGP